MSVSVSSKTFSRDVGSFEIHLALDDEQTDETKSDSIDVREARGITLLVESAATVDGGVVTLEGAASSDYSGTWVSLGSVTTSAGSTAYACSVSASANPESNAAGLPMPYVRARISTAISTSTVDAYIIVLK